VDSKLGTVWFGRMEEAEGQPTPQMTRGNLQTQLGWASAYL